MPRTPETYLYTRQDILKLSDWGNDRLKQDAARGDLNPESLASIVVWLAANGTPWLRAKMASKLLPALFGTRQADARVNEKLELQSSPELLQLAFERDVKPRKELAKKRGKALMAANKKR